MSTLDANKQVVRRHLEDFDYGRLRQDDPRYARLGEICTDDYEFSYSRDGQFHSSSGLPTFQNLISTAMFPTWSSISFTVEDMIAEGDRVAAQITIRGTIVGDFNGYPGNGRAVTFPGNNVFTLRDGKVAGERIYEDFSQVFRQLGALV